MNQTRRFPAYLGAAIFVAAISAACTSGGDTASSGSASTTSASSGGGGEGGGTTSTTTTTTTTTSASSSSGGGEGGGGGAGGGAPAAGKPGTETVSAGQVSTSPSYKMIYTFGQPTQNQGKTTSPGYRLQGGLQGANGSLP